MTQSIPFGLRALAWGLIALVAAAAVAMGWDRGPDALIDFGRELYVPWRLTEGDVLHRDIAWFNGPLGPWVIEGWMRIFGVSLDALQALNALVIAVTWLLLARVTFAIAGEVAAWVAVLMFSTVFAVAQQEAVGNFLFLAPYSHGITFGFAAGLGSIACLGRFGRTGGILPALFSGALLGLAFLSKAEVFLGSALAIFAMALTVLLAPTEATRKRRAPMVGALALGFALPVGLTAARFMAQLGASEAADALLGTWLHAFEPAISQMPFYRMMRGTYDLAESVTRLLLTTAGIGAFVALTLGVAIALEKRIESAPRATLAAFAAAAALTVGAFIFARLKWMLLPLSLVLPAMGILAAANVLRRRKRGSTPREVLLFGFVVLGAGLLPKVLLVPLARQYGFVLSVPGATVLVCLLVRWIPDALARDGRRRAGPITAAGAAIVMVFSGMNANATRNWFATKTMEVGSGADRIRSIPWKARVLNAVIEDVGPRLSGDDTLLVIPEGIGVNYMLRRRTPSRLVNFMPPELVMFSEQEIVASLQAAPPAVIVVTQRPTDIYGHPFIGDGYGEAIMAWVEENYERDRLIENDPFTPGWGNFGAAVLVPR